MLENDLQFSTINNFTGDTFSNDITNSIFKLDKDVISSPINYDGVGFYIFKVNDINKKEVIEINGFNE